MGIKCHVIKYIRTHYPECSIKDTTIYLHLRGLSKNLKSSKKNFPSLYKRAFLYYLDKGMYRLADESTYEEVSETKSDEPDPEAIAREIMEGYFKVKLKKRKLNIFGKYKEFDLVNVERGIVGDVKCYKFRGSNPSAEFSSISEYVWLMEKLEQSTGKRWRKFIVGMGNKEVFEKYAKLYGPWLGDLEIYFINEGKKLEIIRRLDLGV